MQRTDLAELGEFGLIERIKKNTETVQPSTIVGIGDDAAVIDSGSHYTLVATDMLVEGIHFDLSYTPLKHLGYKAVAVNISDIAAMNGFPKQITVSIGLSNRFSVEAVDEIYEGIHAACKNYKVDLVGGDTASSKSGLIISVTAIGEVPKEAVTYRKGAQPNDVLCATGDLGAAYFGLQILEREKQVFMENPNMRPELKEHEYLVGRQLRPEGRTDIIHELKERNVVPTSMIDISDGLASEILHLSQHSGMGFSVFVDNLPIENSTLLAAEEFKVNPITAVVNGGEDYELLMTISQKDYEEIKGIPEITPIGFVTKEKNNILVTKSGEHVQINAQGWKHLENS
ncbi:thiamine-phosphate kinase [Jiulongibacter sediminis]|uniref:Thiamine-monophosphate kinase n=1 Tax=Jiulongibacter sediminis TaxID=1605367 RepID=A0A0P7C8L7_9BACT|nr:thiamine-phosphate kinase [Jiulongibacter sediminis]KPM49991.1 thiamine-monophosphate kinase [Jiulongibacter sediminis]TBX27021.1 thiamine-monophosphate kinase [Jiulongibacter sediminis]